jgi:hypothetical protein
MTSGRRWSPVVRRSSAATMGVSVWLTVGAALAAVLGAASGAWSDGFAVSGLFLTMGGIGWAVGPFKAPMAWSEGALMSYQGNSESPTGVSRSARWDFVLLPACVIAAGILLLVAAGVLAVAY